MEIVSNKKYSIENVLTFRGKVRQETINNIATKAEEVIKKANLEIIGPVITAIHSIENDGSNQLFDFELIVPVSGVMASVDEYIFKDKFMIENALTFRHIGNPQSMNSEMEEFIKYIKENQFKPVTPFYNITIKVAVTPAEIDNMIVDIYVGIECNNS